MTRRATPRTIESDLRRFRWRAWVTLAAGIVAASTFPSAATTAERAAAQEATSAQSAAWPRSKLAWATVPVDLSFLNRVGAPAGRHGFVKAAEGRLIFDDGTPARFWGTNVNAFALFRTSHDNVPRQARRLSQLGFNLVRFHHIDSPWVLPNIFGNDPLDTAQLAETSLEKLDWWIKCLKDEGIYVWLDLHVGRLLTDKDEVGGFDEISKIRNGKRVASLSGYNYLNPGIQDAMRRFNEALLSRQNRYTGLRYKDDPAIAAVLLTNENDLSNHFGNLFLPDKNVPWHSARYMSEADQFAAQHRLSKDKTWRAWEPGPSKIFLNELEHRFNVAMIAHLRGLGLRAPVATTSTWGWNPTFSLPSLTDGDIVDVHSYGRVGELQVNPLQKPKLADWIAAGHVAGRPVSVTEWNVEPFPVADRHAMPLYIAGTASLQGWDALMHFAYAEQPLAGPGKAGNYEAFNDPALIATLPAAALLFRRHDAQEARTTYVYAPTPDQLFNHVIAPNTSVALRTAVDKGKLTIALPKVQELPWLQPSPVPAGAVVITDPQHALIASDAEQAVSDTGELTRDWKKGIYKIDTPRTQAIMGNIGGATFDLKDVKISVETASATVAVQSLDDDPLTTARTVMITLGANAIPDDTADARTFRSEPVAGRLEIRARKGLKLYSQTGSGQSEVPMSFKDGWYRIELKRDLAAYWLIMR